MSYRPAVEADQNLVRNIAWERIHQLHYWRFETAVINAKKPCSGIPDHLSRLDHACSNRLNSAIMSLETCRSCAGQTEIVARTNYR
jgi:hypothetical protein